MCFTPASLIALSHAARYVITLCPLRWQTSGKVKPQTLHIYRVLLEKSVFPLIGKLSIRDMKAPDFLALFRRLEEQKQLYSVKRISIVCGLIMRFAVATGRADIDPMPSLRGSLKAYNTTHLASTTDPKQVGRLIRMIHAYPGSFVVSCAFKIAPYGLYVPASCSTPDGQG